jgi:drug/metabolite transporter (DMT)-like permease
MLGWLLVGETFSSWSLVGAGLVLVGVWMIFRRAESASQEAKIVPVVADHG